jgi:hypothetical protein
MEPFKPKEREEILAAGTITGPELEEYETLLSRRFSVDPDLTMMGAPRKRTAFSANQEKRLAELYAKLPQVATRSTGLAAPTAAKAYPFRAVAAKKRSPSGRAKAATRKHVRKNVRKNVRGRAG